MSMVWLIPAVLTAALTSGTSKLKQPKPDTVVQTLSSKLPMTVTPSKLNQALIDPHQPMLNDSRGMMTANAMTAKTYMGKVEMQKPPTLGAKSPNYARALINTATVPYYNAAKSLRIMFDGYEGIERSQYVPWHKIKPDTRRDQITLRSDKILIPPKSWVRKPGGSPLPPPSLRVAKLQIIQ